MVNECRKFGVNDILVSSLTVRHNFHHRINTINEILRNNARLFNHTFIDNSNIQQHHLQKDDLHLRSEGTDILGNDFIDAWKLRCPQSAFNSTRNGDPNHSP